MEVIDIEPQRSCSPLLNIPPDDAINKEKQLGYLNDVQEIIVRQVPSVKELIKGTEEPNIYHLCDRSSGEKLYQMEEKVGECNACCQRECCGARRKICITVFDKFNRAVIQIRRPLYCYGDCCIPFFDCCSCLDRVQVYVKNYKSLRFEWNLVGIVQQVCNPILPTFNVCDLNGNTRYVLRGPLLTARCFSNVGFRILDPATKATVGNITKEWAGLLMEATSNADRFSVKFPDGEVDEKMKATLLGGMIFIDFKYFE